MIKMIIRILKVMVYCDGESPPIRTLWADIFYTFYTFQQSYKVLCIMNEMNNDEMSANPLKSQKPFMSRKFDVSLQKLISDFFVIFHCPAVQCVFKLDLSFFA